jgi:hypothetical protein
VGALWRGAAAPQQQPKQPLSNCSCIIISNSGGWCSSYTTQLDGGDVESRNSPSTAAPTAPQQHQLAAGWLLSNAAVSSDAPQAAAGAARAGQQPQTAAAAHSNCSCTNISSSSSFIVSWGWWGWGLVQLPHHSARWGRCAEQERGTSWQQLYNSWLPRAATDDNGQERCSCKASVQQQVAALG